MDAREGGIEHLRREKPVSINSFVIDATSSVRKTMELITLHSFKILELIPSHVPSMNYSPLDVRDFIYP